MAINPENLIRRANDDADSLVVDLSEPGQPSEIEIDFDDFGEPLEGAFEEIEQDGDHYDNLAVDMDKAVLRRIATQVTEQVEADEEARAPWRAKFRRGLEIMGILEDDIGDGPFPGASTVVHPTLVEACTQFWARSYGEIFPPSGPAKARVIGEQSQERIAAATRIEEYHNWSLVHEDRGYYRQSSRLMWRLPMLGTGFRKTYSDPLTKRITSQVVEPEDLIICADAKSLDEAPRYTHRYSRSNNDLRKLMHRGVYRRIELTDPEDDASEDEMDLARQESIDIEPTHSTATAGDARTIYEVYVELDLDGHEDVDDEGEPTGIELPYIVTIDSTTNEILAIYRNWSPDDEHKRRENYFTAYEYIPGHGPYGYGLLHLIGGLQEASTGALRALLDSAATASIPGGFVTKDANLKGDRLIIEPGVYQPIECTADEFNKAFVTPPVSPPSPALFQLLGFLTQAAEKFTSTTELQVGQTNKNMPVGTTFALMEAGGRVQSTIHQGLHQSVSHELRIRHEIARATISDEGYPYDVGGDERTVMAADFDAGVSIVPVADPNIFSNAQRVGMAQMALELATQNPDLYDRRAAHRRALEAVKMPDIDELLQKETEPLPYDPPGEVQAIMMGKPVRVVPDQPHALYLQHHAAFLQNPNFGGNPMVAQRVGPQLVAVMGQHLAYAWQQGVSQMGIQTAPLDPETGQPMMQVPPMPPEMLAQALQQLGPQLAQIPGLPGGQQQEQQQGPDQIKQQERMLQLQFDQQKHQQKMQQDAEMHQLKMAQTAQEIAERMRAKQVDIAAQAAKAEQSMEIEAVQAQADAMMKRLTSGIDLNKREQEAELASYARLSEIEDRQADREMKRVQDQVADYERRTRDELDFEEQMRRSGEEFVTRQYISEQQAAADAMRRAVQ
jgi:hypothetical protein